MNKKCYDCMHFKEKNKFCSYFNFSISSVYNAEICIKYSLPTLQYARKKAPSIKSIKSVSCINCNNLILDNYCKITKEYINSTGVLRKCTFYMSIVTTNTTISPTEVTTDSKTIKSTKPIRHTKSKITTKHFNSIRCINCNNLIIDNYCKITKEYISSTEMLRKCINYIHITQAEKQVKPIKSNKSNIIPKPHTSKRCINCGNLLGDDYCKATEKYVDLITINRKCNSYTEIININHTFNNLYPSHTNINTNTQDNEIISYYSQSVKCINCKNLLFESYCKTTKTNIKNIRVNLKCRMFIDKKYIATQETST